MKIEKISDTQIRCTLNEEDLQSRELKLSELAYGTEKAKSLFQDMIDQASHDFGFQADNRPLMIEAIPVSPDCIILVITKVDDPEELEKKFSGILPSMEEISDDNPDETDDFIPMLDTLTADRESDDIAEDSETIYADGESKEDDVCSVSGTFIFNSLDDVCRAVSETGWDYTGISSLYKNGTGRYYLYTACESVRGKDNFARYCSQLSEYGTTAGSHLSRPSFLEEHFECIIRNNAVNILKNL